MSKKFRFYTLEELAERYPAKLTIFTDHVRYQEGQSGLTFSDMGKVVVAEAYREDWMGEEVVVNPDPKTWACMTDPESYSMSIDSKRTWIRITNMSSDNIVEMHMSIKQVNEIIQHLTDIKEYLESKDAKE